MMDVEEIELAAARLAETADGRIVLGALMARYGWAGRTLLVCDQEGRGDPMLTAFNEGSRVVVEALMGWVARGRAPRDVIRPSQTEQEGDRE